MRLEHSEVLAGERYSQPFYATPLLQSHPYVVCYEDEFEPIAELFSETVGIVFVQMAPHSSTGRLRPLAAHRVAECERVGGGRLLGEGGPPLLNIRSLLLGAYDYVLESCSKLVRATRNSSSLFRGRLSGIGNEGQAKPTRQDNVEDGSEGAIRPAYRETIPAPPCAIRGAPCRKRSLTPSTAAGPPRRVAPSVCGHTAPAWPATSSAPPAASPRPRPPPRPRTAPTRPVDYARSPGPTHRPPWPGG